MRGLALYSHTCTACMVILCATWCHQPTCHAYVRVHGSEARHLERHTPTRTARSRKVHHSTWSLGRTGTPAGARRRKQLQTCRQAGRMPLIRRAAQQLLQSWAAPASCSAAGGQLGELVRHMGTERRPGESGAWKQRAWMVMECFGFRPGGELHGWLHARALPPPYLAPPSGLFVQLSASGMPQTGRTTRPLSARPRTFLRVSPVRGSLGCADVPVKPNNNT